MKINFQFKFLIVLFLVILFTNALMPSITFAGVDEEFFDPRQFDEADYNEFSDTPIGSKSLTLGGILNNLFSIVLDIVRIIALSWAILMAFAISIKYMTGSNGIKAQIKSDMPTYVIGAVLLFGAYGLITLIKYFVDYVTTD